MPPPPPAALTATGKPISPLAIFSASFAVATGSVVPGTIGTPAACISSRARVFEPIASIALAGGPMKTMPASAQRLREGRVLGQEAVAGMDRLGARARRHVEDLLDVQVVLRRRALAEVVGLVRARHVQRVAIVLGVDRHRGDPQLLQGAHDADGDLAAVCHQDLREHRAAAD